MLVSNPLVPALIIMTKKTNSVTENKKKIYLSLALLQALALKGHRAV